MLPWLKIVGGLRYDYYYAQIGNSQNSANIFGNTTLPYAAQTITYLSSRAGAIVEPIAAQSYYFSYSTSFNPSLEQLVTTTGTSQPCRRSRTRRSKPASSTSSSTAICR